MYLLGAIHKSLWRITLSLGMLSKQGVCHQTFKCQFYHGPAKHIFQTMHPRAMSKIHPACLAMSKHQCVEKEALSLPSWHCTDPSTDIVNPSFTSGHWFGGFIEDIKAMLWVPKVQSPLRWWWRRVSLRLKLFTAKPFLCCCALGCPMLLVSMRTSPVPFA